MRKLAVILVVMVFFGCISAPALAEERINPKAGSDARWSLFKKAGGFGAGILAGFAGHELGHHLVAKIEGVKMSWRGTDWWAHSDNKRKLRNIALGGFAEEIISSEIILNCDKIPKDNSFVLGYMTFNIVNPILYSLKHEMSRNGYGDLRMLDRNGLKSEYVEIAIASHALWSAYRLWKKPELPLYINATRNEIQIGLTWSW